MSGQQLGSWIKLRAASARIAIFLPHRSRRPESALQAAQNTPVRTLSIADQWSKLASALERAQRSVEHAKSLQAAATQKLDLAQYGLQTLMDDLAAVMTVPGRRQAAPVHVLGSNVVRASTGRPAAYAA